MHKIRLGIVAVMMIGATIADSHAQIVSKGTTEIGGSLSYIIPEEGDNTAFLIANLGYFLSDNIQLTLTGFTGESGGSEFGSIGPGLAYYFVTEGSEIYPYIGAGYQISVGDSGDDSYELNAGLKVGLTERTTLNLGVSYQDQDIGYQILTSVGISYYF